MVRMYHVAQVPQLSRAVRILTASLMSLVFGRDYAELPFADREVPAPVDVPAGGKEVRAS